MLKKTYAAAGLATGAAAGALFLSSPAQAGVKGDDSEINAQAQKQTVSVTNAISNTNTNTATAVSSNAVGLASVAL